MKRIRDKKASLFLAGVLIFTVISLIGGCAQKELIRTGTQPKGNSKVEEKLSLQEVLSETSSTLVSRFDGTLEDTFLISLAALRTKETEVKKEGPVSVSILYPPDMSLIDRTIKITAKVESKYEVDRVEFYIDGELVEAFTSGPYEIDFDPESQTKSRHTIKVVAKSGSHTDSDQVTIYNVIKGSQIIYPWNITGGNIPYSYVNSYFTPDGKVIKEAFFMSYDRSQYYVDYRARLPQGFGYLFAVLSMNPQFLASEATSTEEGSGSLKAYFYDWSRNIFYERPFLVAIHSSDGQETQIQTYEGSLELKPDYEVYDYGNSALFKGLRVAGFPFYAFNPSTKELRVRIKGIGPAKFSLEPMVLNYYGIYDYDTPFIRIRGTKVRDGSRRVDFYVSEPVFLQVYCYNSSKKQIGSFKAAKPEGWNEVIVNLAGTSYVRLKATDVVGKTTLTGFIKLP